MVMKAGPATRAEYVACALLATLDFMLSRSKGEGEAFDADALVAEFIDRGDPARGTVARVRRAAALVAAGRPSASAESPGP